MPCLKESFESDAPIGKHVTSSCAHSLCAVADRHYVAEFWRERAASPGVSDVGGQPASPPGRASERTNKPTLAGYSHAFASRRVTATTTTTTATSLYLHCPLHNHPRPQASTVIVIVCRSLPRPHPLTLAAALCCRLSSLPSSTEQSATRRSLCPYRAHPLCSHRARSPASNSEPATPPSIADRHHATKTQARADSRRRRSRGWLGRQ